MTVSQSDHQPGGAQNQMSQCSTASDLKQSALPFVASYAYAVSNPQDGGLATPINSSKFTRWFIDQLPAYRQGVSSFQRGLQVGLFHGFWLLGPFVVLGPLRDTNLALFAGLLATIGTVVIGTLAIAIYAESTPSPPIATLTTPSPPTDLDAPQGWLALARGFLFGGTAGAIFAAVLLLLFSL